MKYAKWAGKIAATVVIVVVTVIGIAFVAGWSLPFMNNGGEA